MFSHCSWLGCAVNLRRDAHEQLQQQLSGLQDELKELKRERRERLAVPAEQVQPTTPESAHAGLFAPAPRQSEVEAVEAVEVEKIHADRASRSVAPPKVVPNPKNSNPWSDVQAPATETAASIERLSKSDLPERHAAFFFGGKSGPVRGRSMCFHNV